MVMARPPCGWSLRREEWLELHPLGLGERGVLGHGRKGRGERGSVRSLENPPRGMAAIGDGLMHPAPHRPAEAVGAALTTVGQCQDEAANLRHGEGNQVGTRTSGGNGGLSAPLFLAASSRSAARRVTTRKA